MDLVGFMNKQLTYTYNSISCTLARSKAPFSVSGRLDFQNRMLNTVD